MPVELAKGAADQRCDAIEAGFSPAGPNGLVEIEFEVAVDQLDFEIVPSLRGIAFFNIFIRFAHDLTSAWSLTVDQNGPPVPQRAIHLYSALIWNAVV